jgi:hypothetical protein
LRRLRQIYGHPAAARLTYFGIVADFPLGYRDLQVMGLESLESLIGEAFPALGAVCGIDVERKPLGYIRYLGYPGNR